MIFFLSFEKPLPRRKNLFFDGSIMRIINHSEFPNLFSFCFAYDVRQQKRNKEKDGEEGKKQ